MGIWSNKDDEGYMFSTQEVKVRQATNPMTTDLRHDEVEARVSLSAGVVSVKALIGAVLLWFGIGLTTGILTSSPTSSKPTVECPTGGPTPEPITTSFTPVQELLDGYYERTATTRIGCTLRGQAVNSLRGSPFGFDSHEDLLDTVRKTSPSYLADMLVSDTPANVASRDTIPVCEDLLEDVQTRITNSFEEWTDEEKLQGTLLQLMIESDISSLSELGVYRTYMPFSSLFGPQSYLGFLAREPITSSAAFMRYAGFLQSIPNTFKGQLDGLKAGPAKGYFVPKSIMEGVPAQLDVILSMDPNPFSKIGLDAIQNYPEFEQLVSAADITQAGTAVVNAMTDIRDYLVNDFLPNADDNPIGITDRAPNGVALYNSLLFQNTQTRLTAQEIHDIGVSEVSRIRSGMLEIAERAGFTGEDALPLYYEALRNKVENQYNNRLEMLDAHQLFSAQAYPLLPKYFGKNPRAAFGTVAMNAISAQNGQLAFYNSGNPGLASVNIEVWEEARRHTVASLMLHEGVPGHHFQISLAEELDQVPKLFLLPHPRLSGTAFAEGWGLYTEFLGEEMGAYITDDDLFGRYQLEMLRATRLVVDTGMHALGWNQTRAIDYMLDNFAGGRDEIVSETNRYLTIPGQACAYKIGEIFMRRLRTEAEVALGDKFSIRDFHDLLLSRGSVALPVLEVMVKNWVKKVLDA